LVEAPLDAIAVVAAHPEAMAIASGGDQLPPEKLAQWIPEGAEVFAGYDADQRGDQVAKKAKETLNAQRLKPSRKDWAETVKNEPWRVDPKWDDPSELKEQKTAPRPVLRPR
jgi:DNA primase